MILNELIKLLEQFKNEWPWPPDHPEYQPDLFRFLQWLEQKKAEEKRL